MGKIINYRRLFIYIITPLLFLTLLTSCLLSGLYAKYVSGSGNLDSARVATYDMSVTNEIQESFAVSILPGQSVDYVCNFINNGETAMRCTVYAVKITDEIPHLIFPEPVWYELSANGGAENNVTYTITWDETKTDEQYAGRVELIKIIIRAEQID